jgi:arylsulfatase A-like enzyme
MDSSLPFRRLTVVTLALLVALAGIALACGPVSAAQTPLPNILLIVMDDIGIDQWKLFGYGGTTPAATPNIDAIAAAGIKFHNLWAMPACSNGRAALFTGRYPLRTHVYTALGNNDLANFMVNPSVVCAVMLAASSIQTCRASARHPTTSTLPRSVGTTSRRSR